jgi:hypothetical protein
MSPTARATDEWDLSDPSENVDWYSEYIARNAQLSSSWLSPQGVDRLDVKGVTVFEHNDSKKLVGALEDGSLRLWDLNQQEGATSRHSQIRPTSASSKPGILFSDNTTSSESSQTAAKRALSFSGVADCIGIDPTQKRAYVAVGDLLNEVDLNTLKVISQSKYAWTVTALSHIQTPYQPLTVGTSFSLHILDTRSPSRDRSRSAADSADLGETVAFLPNKDVERDMHPARLFQIHPLDGFGTNDSRSPPEEFHTPSLLSSTQSRRNLIPHAKLEPAPLSILHQSENSIMVAGRFPSIVNYDRRYFPRLEYAIHSGARLSALAYLPFSPRGIKYPGSTGEGRGTLISCGEYNGRGSLELYSVPDNISSMAASSSPNNVAGLSDTWDGENTATSTFADLSSTTNSNPDQASIYSYKNRQSISSAKLLSVATQGTRIVFSDANGSLKWMERDGKTIARRWNINSHQARPSSSSSSSSSSSFSFPQPGSHAAGVLSGPLGGLFATGEPAPLFEAAMHDEEVVRKIIPIGPGAADDLLVWTGERVGLVGMGRNPDFYDALEDVDTAGAGKAVVGRGVVESFDGFVGPRVREEAGSGGGGSGDLEEQARRYDTRMRRARERQADELNWMQQFGLGPTQIARPGCKGAYQIGRPIRRGA